MSKKRCPNGYRRNRAGECIKHDRTKKIMKEPMPQVEPMPELEPGEILEENPVFEKPLSAKSITPRTIYAKKQFEDKPVFLLANAKPLADNVLIKELALAPSKTPSTPSPSSPKETPILFQVSISGPEQFTHYANLSKDSKKKKIDCFFQSVFSLGLRDVSIAKKDAEEINELGKDGVKFSEASRYFASSFGIPQKHIEYAYVHIGTANNKIAIKHINDFMNTYLENDHATVFTLYFYKYRKSVGAHFMVAYKYKNVVFYFDPQQKGVVEDKKILSKTLAHLIKYSGYNFIDFFGYYKVNGLDEPIQMINVKCPVRYIG